MNEIQVANSLPTSFKAIVNDKEIRNCVIMRKPHDYPGWASGHAEIRMTVKRWTDICEYQKEARRQTHNLMISNLNGFKAKNAKIKHILEQGLPVMDTKFTNLLLKHFTLDELYGKSIKDKRGGSNSLQGLA